MQIPKYINYDTGRIRMYEPKRKEYINRWLLPSIEPLLQAYVKDYHIPTDEVMFTRPENSEFYRSKMVRAGKLAQLSHHVTTHIMKHTFVSQAFKHNMTTDKIVEQTGTDWETLKKAYAAEHEALSRAEFRGEKLPETEPFREWYAKLMPTFLDNYERIKRSGIVDGVRGKIEEDKTENQKAFKENDRVS